MTFYDYTPYESSLSIWQLYKSYLLQGEGHDFRARTWLRIHWGLLTALHLLGSWESVTYTSCPLVDLWPQCGKNWGALCYAQDKLRWFQENLELYFGVNEENRKCMRCSHFEVTGNFYQPMTNLYGPDCGLYIEIVPHLSKFLSYKAKEGLASPPLLTRPWLTSLASHTPSTTTTTLSHGEPWPMNKDSTLTGGRKGARNLQNHQLNPKAALVCQHKNVMSQSSLQYQDPPRNCCQNVPYSPKPTFIIQRHQIHRSWLANAPYSKIWCLRNCTFLWMDPKA